MASSFVISAVFNMYYNSQADFGCDFVIPLEMNLVCVNFFSSAMC